MRLVSWNCAMGFRRKLAALVALRPDIAILSEVACPDRLRLQVPKLSELPIVWVGDSPNKGLAVVSFAGDELVLDGSYRSTNQYIAPVHLKGPKPFRFFAVCDNNTRKHRLHQIPAP